MSFLDAAVHELLFTVDGLLDGERKLVSFDSTVGPCGRFTTPEGEYEIARRKRSGWHMELKDSSTEIEALPTVCVR